MDFEAWFMLSRAYEALRNEEEVSAMDPLRGTKHEFCAVNSKIFLSEHGKAMILITKPSSRT